MPGKDKKRGKLRAPARFTVEAAASFLKTATDQGRRSDRLRIDLSEVEVVDTAALQLLAVLRRAMVAEGRRCDIGGASEALRDGASLLGLEQLLELA